jgi:hypothetical protein
MIKFLATSPESVPMCEVVDQYDSFFRLGLTDEDKSELIQYLMGPKAPHSASTSHASGQQETDYEPHSEDAPFNPGGLP